MFMKKLALILAVTIMGGGLLAAAPLGAAFALVGSSPQTPNTSGTGGVSATQQAAGGTGVGATKQACQGAGTAAGSSTCSGNGIDLSVVIKSIVNVLSIVVGIAAVIMIIVGGIKFVTSAGDAQAAASAKNTIIYALVGVVIAVLAQILVYFVLNTVSSLPANQTTTTSKH